MFLTSLPVLTETGQSLGYQTLRDQDTLAEYTSALTRKCLSDTLANQTVPTVRQ